MFSPFFIPTIGRHNTRKQNIGNGAMILCVVGAVVALIVAMVSQPSYTERARDNYGITVGKAYSATNPQLSCLARSKCKVLVGVTTDNGKAYGLAVLLERVDFDPRDDAPVTVLATFTFGNGTDIDGSRTLQRIIDADYNFRLKLTLPRAQYEQLMQ